MVVVNVSIRDKIRDRVSIKLRTAFIFGCMLE